MNFLDDELDSELREQIFKYFVSSFMSDSERARLLQLPKSCRIREGAKIISPENLTLGNNVWIGENAILDASGGLTIGDNTQIGLSVFVWTHSSLTSAIRGENTKNNKENITRKKSKIGANCFISGPSVILPGVRIGDKCVIPPLSLVSGDMPEGTVYKNNKLNNIRKELKEKDKKIESLVREIEVIKQKLGIE